MNKFILHIPTEYTSPKNDYFKPRVNYGQETGPVRCRWHGCPSMREFFYLRSIRCFNSQSSNEPAGLFNTSHNSMLRRYSTWQQRQFVFGHCNSRSFIHKAHCFVTCLNILHIILYEIAPWGNTFCALLKTRNFWFFNFLGECQEAKLLIFTEAINGI